MYKYNEQPTGFRIPAKFGLDDATEADVREQVWEYLLLGAEDPDYVFDLLQETTDLDDQQIDELAAFMVDARMTQQAEWSEEETSTNLDRAFADLEANNVLGLQDFTCCGTCAATEMPGEFDDSRNWIGGVYFHRQDTERLVTSDSVYLGFGARVPAWTTKEDWDALDDDAKEAAYQEWSMRMMKQVVIPVLLHHGIDVDWNEQFDTRPMLKNAHFYRKLKADY